MALDQPASKGVESQECVLRLSLAWMWLASRPASWTLDVCSHMETLAQESPVLGLMSVVSILKFLVLS